MNQNPPTVSVVIPAYNRADLIAKAINSVIRQTFTEFEIIVVDDASTDDTKEVISCIQDDRIRYLRHEKNRGGPEARNTGIRSSKGRFIAFLDSDDEWLPGKLQKQIDRLEGSKKNAGAILCGHICQDDDTGYVVKPHTKLSTGDSYKRFLGGLAPTTTSALMVKKNLLEHVGPFDSSLHSFEDYDMCLRLARICPFEAVDEPLLIYHLHDEYRLSRDSNPRLRGLKTFMRKWHREMKREAGVDSAKRFYHFHLSDIYSQAVLDCLRSGNRQKALKHFIKFLKTPNKISRKRGVLLAICMIVGSRFYDRVVRLWRQCTWSPREKMRIDSTT